LGADLVIWRKEVKRKEVKRSELQVLPSRKPSSYRARYPCSRISLVLSHRPDTL